MTKTLIAALAFGLFAAASANAVSWDCTKSRSYSEKLICASPDLSKMDDHLAVTYEKAKKATGNSAVFSLSSLLNVSSTGTPFFSNPLIF